MHPNLVSIGPLTIRSYGTMIVIGLIMGILLIRKRHHDYGILWEKCLDLTFYLMLAGAVGAKILYWIIFPKMFISELNLLVENPKEFLAAFGTGFVFFGALIGGAITLVFYTRKHNLSIRKSLDLFTPSIPLAHAFGRIGCFLAGCCYGKECHMKWSVVFTHKDSLAPLNSPLHPTQLYESAFLFVMTGVMLLSSKKIERISGRMLPLYAAFYGIWRIFIEFFRGDPRGDVFNGLMTTTQFISIIIIIVCIVSYMILTIRGNNNLTQFDVKP